MKETRLINRFSEKILIWGNGPFCAQKMHILITLDPLEEFFFKFCTMRGANWQIRMIIIIFQKKVCWENGPFWAQKWRIVITLDLLSEFFEILHNEKGQWVDESNNDGLYQKKKIV